MRFSQTNRKHCFKNGLLRQVFFVLTHREIQQMADKHQADKWHKKFFAVDHLRVALGFVLLSFRSFRSLAVGGDSKTGPVRLRLVKAQDQKGNCWEVLTNHFDLTALEICLLYRKRWNIENFFRTLKRQLDLRELYVANANALMIIILCTLIAYCLARALVQGSSEKYTLAEAIFHLQNLSPLLMNGIEAWLSEPPPKTQPIVDPVNSIIVNLILS